MSENIKVSEVSDILRKQLEGINTHVQLDEIGTVLQVSDGVCVSTDCGMPRLTSYWSLTTALRLS